MDGDWESGLGDGQTGGLGAAENHPSAAHTGQRGHPSKEQGLERKGLPSTVTSG